MLRENSFTFEDYLEQFDKINKMGNINDIIAMIPGLSNKLGGQIKAIDENQLKRNKAIIQSMTIKERRNPNILNGSRKKRIANGSGTSIQEVNALIKQFEQTKDMMKQFGKNKKMKF